VAVEPVEGQSQFAEFQDIVADLVPLGQGIGDAIGAGEAVDPADGREAEALAASLAVFLVDVAFFSAEAAGQGVEAEPALAAGGEEPQSLGEDREGLPVGVSAAGVTAPNSPHLGPPDILEVCPDVAPVIRDEDPLEEVIAGVMGLQVFPQPLDAAEG
jgi:hypothetical protein